MPVRFPGETSEYRTARDQLLAEEIALRAQVERVATLRRQLPDGGAVAEDYRFHEGGSDPADVATVRPVRLSELFGEKDCLVLYSYMYGATMDEPCPLCTSFLDGLEAQAQHIGQRVALAVSADSPSERIRTLARGRGWKRLRLVSSHGGTYQRDYHGNNADGEPYPMMNVFTKRNGSVRHSWGSEMLYADTSDGLESRHIDMLWPLWNVLDLTPAGRGTDWYPALRYP